MKPLVSVIVPCRNEEDFIARSLDSILANDYPRLEVIVADGMSRDATRELLRRRASRDPRLRVIDNPERGTPAALNRAIAASSGEILLRFDAHAVMPSDYVGRCVALLESSGAQNAGGAIRTVPQTAGIFAGPIVAVLSSPFGVGNSAFRTSSRKQNAGPADTVFGGCWRREVFARIGGFNEKLARGQDLEFNLRLRRAGGTIVLDPQIVSDYYARADLARFWTHNFTNGVWAVLPFAHSDVLPVGLRHLVPLAFVLSLFLSLALPFPWSTVILSAYVAANVGASAWEAFARRRPAFLALLPAAFACLHFAYGLGSAWGCLRLAWGAWKGNKTCKPR